MLEALTIADGIRRRACGCAPWYITCAHGRALQARVQTLQQNYLDLIRQALQQRMPLQDARRIPAVEQVAQQLMEARHALAKHLELEK